jgi:hypothetical protein
MRLRRALLANITPRANPIIAPRKAAVTATLAEDTPLVPANKKPTYARHSVQKIRRTPIGLIEIGHVRRNSLSVYLLQRVPQSQDSAALV